MANIEASQVEGDNNWALLLGTDGFITEGTGDNFFIIKDNVGFGEWDWDILANDWNVKELEEWGLDGFPFDIEENWPAEINNIEMTTYHQWMEVVIPVSLVGLPAINIPCGFNEQNLPMGLQLFGATGSDKSILKFAQNYHLKTEWPNRNRPIL